MSLPTEQLPQLARGTPAHVQCGGGKDFWRNGRVRLAGLLAAAAALLVGIGLSLFRHWEMSGEMWACWLFARLFTEQGTFIIPDRSPLYVLYVSAFRWLGYPSAVTAEFVVTSFVMAAMVVGFFTRFLGRGPAVLAALLWLPYLQGAEPAVQGLALAASLGAVMVRMGGVSRVRLVLSYALLGVAYLFRSSSVVLVVVFGVADLAHVVNTRGWTAVRTALRPRRVDWPLLVLVGFVVLVHLRQSSHPWNNAYRATTTWFADNGRSLGDSHLIQGYNIIYLRDHYRTFEGRDFYFTNQELFGGATTAWGVLRANPRFVVTQTVKNLRTAITMVPKFTLIPMSVVRIRPFRGLLNLLLLAAIIFGALRASPTRLVRLFVLANLVLLASTVLILPEVPRYYVPMVPLLILAAGWCGQQARRLLAQWTIARPSWIRGGVGGAALPLALVLGSNGLPLWSQSLHDLRHDLRTGQFRVLESPPQSMKASASQLQPLVAGCRGILTLEHAFVGAFLDTPLERVYDVWEIPPFGQLGDGGYTGLRPDRIDCLLISDELATGVGQATNYQLRYQHYIRPYAEQLVRLGARTYDIPSFGRAVIYRWGSDPVGGLTP